MHLNKYLRSRRLRSQTLHRGSGRERKGENLLSPTVGSPLVSRVDCPHSILVYMASTAHLLYMLMPIELAATPREQKLTCTVNLRGLVLLAPS